MADVPDIHGTCDARFAPVREALAANFRDRGELGAAVATWQDGRWVTDLWAGCADEARRRPWGPDTLVDVFSAGKAVAALAALRLVERGRLALDAPVARWWPEFAAHGKEGITLRMLLAHRAGLPGLRGVLPDGAMYDWSLMARALAAETPWWVPGTAHGYHVNTFGFLVGEAARRAGGMGIDALVRREITGPLGADFHFGIGAEHDARIADFVFAPELFAADRAEADADDARERVMRDVYLNPPGISGVGTVNTRPWRSAVMPSTNGHASARGLARIYAALACGGTDGVRVLERETLDEAIREASAGMDVILRRPSRFGLGFQLAQDERPLGRSPRCFGHFGAGGAVGFADPEARLAFAYVMNRAGPRWQNPRNRALLDAVRACS